MSHHFAIVGVTGHVGGVIAEQLLAAGHKVRGLVRDESSAAAKALKSQGVELAVATLTDTAALTKAFTGVDGVFVMTPPLFNSPDWRSEHKDYIKHLTAAVEAAKVTKIVVLSSIGAEHDAGTGAILKLHDLEVAWKNLHASIAYIRAGYFAENALGLVALAKAQGIFPSMVTLDKKLPVVATKDIGILGAKLLQEKWEGKRFIEFEGPEQLSYNELAAIVGKVLNKTVTPIPVPQDQWNATWQSFGASENSAQGMSDLVAGLNGGLISFTCKHESAKGTTTWESLVQHAAQ